MILKLEWWKMEKKKTVEKSLDLNKFSSNRTKEEYKNNIKESLNQQKDLPQNLDEHWSKISNVCLETAAKTIGYVNQIRRHEDQQLKSLSET